MPRVAVGGTFDPIHCGHLALLKEAFDIAGPDGSVNVGLTSDEMARGHRTRPVRSFDARKKDLQSAIKKHIGRCRYEIVKIHDPYGPALCEDFDYIAVSPETEPVAERINKIRAEKGLSPIKISKIEYQLAEDHVRISSTRIAEGKIDVHGRMLAGAKKAESL